MPERNLCMKQSPAIGPGGSGRFVCDLLHGHNGPHAQEQADGEYIRWSAKGGRWITDPADEPNEDETAKELRAMEPARRCGAKHDDIATGGEFVCGLRRGHTDMHAAQCSPGANRGVHRWPDPPPVPEPPVPAAYPCCYCGRADARDPERPHVERCVWGCRRHGTPEPCLDEDQESGDRRCSREREHGGEHVVCKANEDHSIEHVSESWPYEIATKKEILESEPATNGGLLPCALCELPGECFIHGPAGLVAAVDAAPATDSDGVTSNPCNALGELGDLHGNLYQCNRKRGHEGEHALCDATGARVRRWERSDTPEEGDREPLEPPAPDETVKPPAADLDALFEKSLKALRDLSDGRRLDAPPFAHVIAIAVLTKLSLDLWIQGADEKQEDAGDPTPLRLAFSSGYSAAQRSQINTWRRLALSEGQSGTLEGIHAAKRIIAVADWLERESAALPEAPGG